MKLRGGYRRKRHQLGESGYIQPKLYYDARSAAIAAAAPAIAAKIGGVAAAVWNAVISRGPG